MAMADVEYLRDCLRGTSRSDRKYMPSTLWVAVPDTTRIPFALPTRYGNLIFVFADRDERYSYFRDVSATMLTEEARLEEMQVVVDHVWQVAIICTQATPSVARPQAHVLIEGSALFERMMRELADGTIWPEPDAS
jgi:hypothetical protein